MGGEPGNSHLAPNVNQIQTTVILPWATKLSLAIADPLNRQRLSLFRRSLPHPTAFSSQINFGLGYGFYSAKLTQAPEVFYFIKYRTGNESE